jgi:hypothetical protein
MENKIKNYITLYDDTFSSEDCNNLIDKFENNSSLHELKSITASDGWHMQFTQINLPNHKIFAQENKKLRALFLEAISAYKKEHNIKAYQWPQKFNLEPIRMKRYLPNSKDMFNEHVEVTNLETARRFMVAFIYLNDDFSGGETDFPQFKILVKPKQGNMVLFPAMWNWLHKGCPVQGENPKYIVGTMMHYI